MTQQRTAREVAHEIVCERQQSEWCHWTTDRTVHAHYCDFLTVFLESDRAETRRLALQDARDAIDAVRKAEWNEQRLLGATDAYYAVDSMLRATLPEAGN